MISFPPSLFYLVLLLIKSTEGDLERSLMSGVDEIMDRSFSLHLASYIFYK